MPGFSLFFKSAGAFACADGFVPTLRHLPKQKDKKSLFLLSFGAPKETKALAEIIASALLEKCRKTGQGWFYCCKTRYATFGRHTLAVLQAFFNSTLANTEFPHGLPAALNIMVEYLRAFQIMSLLTHHHELTGALACANLGAVGQ